MAVAKAGKISYEWFSCSEEAAEPQSTVSKLFASTLGGHVHRLHP